MCIRDSLNVKQIMVTELKVEDDKVTGIVTELGEFYGAKAVILCTGTYLKGKILIGDIDYVGGPNGQRVAEHFSQSLLDNGIELPKNIIYCRTIEIQFTDIFGLEVTLFQLHD